MAAPAVGAALQERRPFASAGELKNEKASSRGVVLASKLSGVKPYVFSIMSRFLCQTLGGSVILMLAFAATLGRCFPPLSS